MQRHIQAAVEFLKLRLMKTSNCAENSSLHDGEKILAFDGRGVKQSGLSARWSRRINEHLGRFDLNQSQ
jgi:hypothetical protein